MLLPQITCINLGETHSNYAKVSADVILQKQNVNMIITYAWNYVYKQWWFCVWSPYFTRIFKRIHHLIYIKYAIMSIVLPSIQNFRKISRSEHTFGQKIKYVGGSVHELRFCLPEREYISTIEFDNLNFCDGTEPKSHNLFRWGCKQIYLKPK